MGSFAQHHMKRVVEKYIKEVFDIIFAYDFKTKTHLGEYDLSW